MDVVTLGDCRLIHADCREVLPTLGRFDAVITDPPYGINENSAKVASRGKLAAATDYGFFDWDKSPVSDDLIAQVIAAGRHAIVFGGNYYDLPKTSCWLVWDKLNGDNDFADCELAWTNLPKAIRRIQYLWNGMMRANGEKRGDHPTQKPLGVMAWCIEQAGNPQTILDPFMGSGTTGVACVQLGRKFTGIERERKYFDIACERISRAQAQGQLIPHEMPQHKQVALELTGDLEGLT